MGFRKIAQWLLLFGAMASFAAYAQQPRLLLISIDGLRWDYIQQHQPPFLTKLARQSAQVERLLPVYPSKTFPNHLALATGLYAENHGIVANRFYSPDLERRYKLSDPKAVTDGRFYSGVPIWSLAEQQGIPSAIYFWPGSEAEIAGERPSYFKKYNSRDSHNKRVDQVLQWFRNDQARFVALYFSSVDRAGHDHGPTSVWTQRALQSVDKRLQRLFDGLAKLPFDVNVVLTSDHGMRDVSDMPRLYLDKRLAAWPQVGKAFRFSGSGSTIRFYHRGSGDKASDLARLQKLLKGHDDAEFFLRSQIPDSLHYRNHSAVGDALLISNSHFITYTDAKTPPTGFHGFDPLKDEQMHTTLLAFGPAFNTKVTVPQARTVDLYPLMAKVLGLTIQQPIDGDPKVLAPLLK